MSIDILHQAYLQGTRKIICTSHSWGNMEKYFSNITRLQNLANNRGINIDLYPGCEIDCCYCTAEENIRKLNQNKIPTMNGTKFVLIEFDKCTNANTIINYVKQIHIAGYNTIIAHTERHLGLLKQPNYIPMLQQLGCLFQVNAYSFQNEINFQIKTFAKKLLKEKYITFIGSDVHRTNHRSYMIQNGIDYIYKNCDEEYARNICYKNAERILNTN